LLFEIWLVKRFLFYVRKKCKEKEEALAGQLGREKKRAVINT